MKKFIIVTIAMIMAVAIFTAIPQTAKISCPDYAELKWVEDVEGPRPGHYEVKMTGIQNLFRYLAEKGV